METYTVEPGDTIWSIAVMMRSHVTVFFPLGCYLRADGRFDIIEDHFDPEEFWE